MKVSRAVWLGMLSMIVLAAGFLPRVVAPADSYEPDGTSSQATLITSGTSQTHSISPIGDVDWMRFTLIASMDVTIEVTECSYGDTVMRLYESDGTTQITYDDDSGIGFCSKIQQQSMPPGTYYIHLIEYNSNSEIAAYVILLTATPIPQPDSYEDDDTSGQAKDLLPDAPQTHSIAPAGDHDWAKFNLKAKTNVTIETSGVSGDTELYLYESDGLSLVAYDDDSGPGLFSRINMSSLDAGTYFVLVEESSYSARIASYTLRLWTGLGPTPSPAANIGLILIAVLIPIIVIVVLVLAFMVMRSRRRAPAGKMPPYYQSQQPYGQQYWPQQHPQMVPQQGPPAQGPPPQQGPPAR